MHPLPHRYDAKITGTPDGYAQLSSAGLPHLRVAAPADFDGPGDAWSPEHMLVAAVQTCFLLTFRGIARKARLEFITLEVDASGVVDRADGVTRFTEITLRPKLSISAAADQARARDVLAKAEKNCLVSASLSTPVRLEPEIVTVKAVA
jgi:peroxiredoxin-like protein